MEKVKILAIDDNADNIMVLKVILSRTFPAAAFISTSSGKSGIEMYTAWKPDLVLLNIDLSEMEGYEICQILKSNKSTESIPVIMLTDARTDRKCRIKALEAGADAFLAKPFDESELTALVRAMIRIKESEDLKLDENERLKRLVEERTHELHMELQERKRFEEALMESEVRFRHISSSISDLSYSCVIDSSGNSTINWLFGASERITGYTVDELFAMKCWGKIVADEDFPVFKTHILNVLPGKSDGCQLRLKKKDGDIVWVQASAECVKEQNDSSIATLYGGLVDITDRKLAEQARRESYDFNQSLLQTIPFGMDIVDEEGNILFQNQTLKNFFGLHAIGKKCWELYRDDKTQCSDCPLHEGIEIGKTKTYQASGALGGRVFEINHTGMMFKGKKAMLEIFMEITDRKLAEEKLRESEQLFQGLFNASPDAIVLIDPHHPTVSWPIIDCNIASCQMNGYSRDEMIGHSIDLLNTRVGTDQDRATYYTELRQNGIIHGEFVHRHKDGHQFPVEVSTTIVTIGGRELVLGIDRDISGRRQSEKELEKSYNLLHKLTAQVPGVVYQYRLYPDGHSAFPFSTQGMYDIYEVTSEEVREDASPVFTRIHPDDFDLIVETINDSARNQTNYHSEFRVILPRQGLRWRMCDAKPELLEDGSTLWHGIISDITDRKLAELALKESEDRYRGFISQVSEGVYRFECKEPIDISLPVEEQIDLIYDHMYIAECNRAILKMYNLGDEKEMIGKTALDFHGGRNNPVNRETFRSFIRNGYQVENAVTEELNSKGQQLYISNNSLGIIENNKLVRMWGTQTDVTEKMNTDQVQHVLFSISNAALSSIDLPKLIEFISQEVGKLLDSTNFYIAFYDEKTDMLSTIYERDEKDVIDSWPAENSITGYVIKHQKSILIKDIELQDFYEKVGIQQFGTPSKIWLGVPLLTNNKAIGAIVVQSYDNADAYTEKDKLMLEFISHQISISIERKKHEQELKEAMLKAQESDRLKSAFLANMSHEIRTPLNSIIGFSELLLDKDYAAEQHDEFATMINSSGNGLLTIISDIMDLSKIEAGQVKVNKNRFSVNQLVNDIRKEYSYKASAKGVELIPDPDNPEEELFIENDEPKLRQILINFVGNAIKFTEKGSIKIGFGPLRLDQGAEISMEHSIQNASLGVLSGLASVRDHGSTEHNRSVELLRFFVKDTGIGIPDEYHQQIFERFRQVESSDTRKYGGNGLGLAITKSLIELLGGHIGMNSEPGKGTTFYFTTPI